MLVQVLQTICLVLGGILGLAYAYQVIYLFVPILFGGKKLAPAKVNRRYAILIAARNEETVIASLLQSIQDQDYPKELYTTYVVADNCTDGTAKLAARQGARVYSRFNDKQIGKGYALQYLLEQIAREEGGWERYDAFLVFDADNVLSPNYLAEINKVPEAGYEVFTGYRNSKNFGNSWISMGHSIWYLHDSCHLSQSRMRVGVTCAVTGTGFGFTRQLLERMGGWDFHTLTEDIEFSVWCASQGIRIGYSHNAILYDEQPNTMKVSWKQRTRWAQGGLQISFTRLKDFGQGLLRGGRTTWGTFEALTLSLWGYGTAGASAVLSPITAALAGGIWGLGAAVVAALVGAYVSMAFMAALTVLTEWKRIKAPRGKKILSIFLFPIYMATFAPIAVLAVFRKFEWVPVEHKEAIDMESVKKDEEEDEIIPV